MPQPQKANVFGLLKAYKGWIFFLVLLAVASNALTLALPKIIAGGVDAYTAGHFMLVPTLLTFGGLAVGIFFLNYALNVSQTYASERVARDLRRDVTAKLSTQSYAFVQDIGAATLLTNITSDIDAVKTFVSQAVVSIVSSVFVILGASVLLLLTDWKLALAVLTVVPLIGGTFFFVLSRIRALFLKTREVIDWLNRVINESILGAALIRVLHSENIEHDKFMAANTRAKDLGMQILNLFASMIPLITFLASMAGLMILVLGGHFVITGAMTLGSFTAFQSYLALLIFPIILIGFMSNVIAQAQAAYGRVAAILVSKPQPQTGTVEATLRGDVAFDHVNVQYGNKPVLKDVSITIKAGSKTAIIGPTAAGKTQLLYLLAGLIRPTDGKVLYDGVDRNDYQQDALHRQVAFVFQDSVMFNLSLRENIAFSETVRDEDLQKAIEAAELGDFIKRLPQGLDTVVSERGTSLSGGQKQRIMLARALALNPRVLLLDDFTARVDAKTEQTILANVARLYPGITLISVTQKIAPVEGYDQIILLMEGEFVASGKHAELMKSCPEYVQIYESQQSTSHYEELHA